MLEYILNWGNPFALKSDETIFDTVNAHIPGRITINGITEFEYCEEKSRGTIHFAETAIIIEHTKTIKRLILESKGVFCCCSTVLLAAGSNIVPVAWVNKSNFSATITDIKYQPTAAGEMK